MKVLGPDGPLDAAQLVPGAKVHSYENGELVVGTVTGRGLTGSQEIFKVTANDTEHRFGSGHRLMQENRGWVMCKDLKPGIRVLFLEDGKYVPREVTSVEPDGIEETWDIEVDKVNYVLESGVLCHNSACNCTCEFWVWIPPLLSLFFPFV